MTYSNEQWHDASGGHLTDTSPERGVLVGIDWIAQPSLLPMEDSLAELALLASTANVKVVGEVTQRLERPRPATLIGTGKIEELLAIVLETNADVVLFDEELSPRQQRELENALGEDVKVIDRPALILDIFASHASTREGAVQVELAQYEYRLPRLTRAWTHLARQAGGRAGGIGGGVGVRGPGETQLEVDRREIGRRIAMLKRQLNDIRKQRDQHRRKRKESAIPVIGLVGYTNAGKSTLLNRLTNADVRAEDQLFATLDPTTRRAELPSGHHVLLTDTVGFIQKLPTELAAAFRATLEEVTEADMLLHVVDASHPNVDEQVAAVEEVLEDLEADEKPIITALNKVDKLDRTDLFVQERLEDNLREFPEAVAVSARTGEGIDTLLERLDEMLYLQMVSLNVLLPYDRGDLVSQVHSHGFIEEEEHTPEGTRLVAKVPVQLAGLFSDYLTSAKNQ